MFPEAHREDAMFRQAAKHGAGILAAKPDERSAAGGADGVNRVGHGGFGRANGNVPEWIESRAAGGVKAIRQPGWPFRRYWRPAKEREKADVDSRKSPQKRDEGIHPRGRTVSVENHSHAQWLRAVRCAPPEGQQ